VLIGRSSRCSGSRALTHGSVSRVHALLIRRDGRILLADAGSTNGIWRDGEQVKCAGVEHGVEYCLGEHASLRWCTLD